MSLAVLLNVIVFAAVVAWLARRAIRGARLSTNVMLAVGLGVLLGAAVQATYGLGSPIIRETMNWVGLVGGGYVRLLDASGEFTAEVVTSPEGLFRFFAAPGQWTLRALSRHGNGDLTVDATRGINEVGLAVAA